jgi:hypothetical protein
MRWVGSEQYLTQRWSRRLFTYVKMRPVEVTDVPMVNCQQLEAALADNVHPVPTPGKEISMRDVVVNKVRPAKQLRTDEQGNAVGTEAERQAGAAAGAGLSRDRGADAKSLRPAHRAKGI